MANDLSKPLRVSRDGRFLCQADGAPFFWLGDTAWMLMRALTLDEADTYFQDRAEKGFTVIQTAAVFGGYGTGDPLTSPNRRGDVPFRELDPISIDPAYFDHIECVIDHAHRRGLRLAMVPLWGLDLINGREVFDPSGAESFGRWVGQRFQKRGIFWILGGDVSPIAPQYWTRGPTAVKDYRPVWDAMARGIIEGQGDGPLLTYHPWPHRVSGLAEPRTSLYFGDRDWLSMNMLQSGHCAETAELLDRRSQPYHLPMYSYELVQLEYNSKPVRPIIDGEPRYEDHPLLGLGLPASDQQWNDTDVRNSAYQAVFSGAAGHTYGHGSVWNFYDADRGEPPPGFIPQPWIEALQAPGAGQMKHLKNLLLSRPYFGRIPDQSVIVSAIGSGEHHLVATRDRRGSFMMVYLPRGEACLVDLTKLGSPVAKFWWFNPRDGAAELAGDGTVGNDCTLFSPPSHGFGHDWVLVIDDASHDFPPPGHATLSLG